MGKIEHLLAFLDSAEIVLEVGSFLIGGNTAKWIVISSVQILKCTWRAIYVVKKKKLFKRQILEEINRENLNRETKTKEENLLQRSGRTIRSIDDELCAQYDTYFFI